MSTLVSRVSAALLFIAGVLLLFVPDAILPRLAPNFPPAAIWVGQLLGAAWLGMAALNWTARAALLGGIYGRAVVYANFVLYFVSTLTTFKAAQRAGFPTHMWCVIVPAAVMAIVYAWLLFRGPTARDLAAANQ